MDSSAQAQRFQFPWARESSYYSKEYSRLKDLGEFTKEGSLKIAVLGSHTLQYFSKTLAVRLFEQGVHATVWTAPYAQIESQLLDPNSEMRSFKPDYVLVVQDLTDALGEDAKAIWSATEHDNLQQQALAYNRRLIDAVKTIGAKGILLTNYIIPTSSVLGSSEFLFKGERRFVAELNLKLSDLLAGEKNSGLVDLESACASAGKTDLDNERFKLLGDVRLNFKQSVMLADETCGCLIALGNLSKKCIVLDLDNTLWGGVIGEDGIEGIKLGQTEPIGKAFRQFQKEIKALNSRGVILAINSRNNLEDALQVITSHSEMVLKEKDFAAIKANWQDKATNLQELAKELNIGLDSMVFIDDDAFNIALVKEKLPQVTSILLPEDPAAYALLLRSLRLFDSRSLTEEDLKRSQMYFQDRVRRTEEQQSGSLEEFLAKLNLQVAVDSIDNITLPRVSQLSLRTNQFNMTTKRYSEQELQDFLSSANNRGYCMTVKDRFGEYGIIGACLATINGSQAELDSFFMSCRVLGKGVEDTFIWRVLNELAKSGVKTVKAKALPTKKNAAFLDFYAKTGFAKTGENEFTINLDQPSHQFPKHILMEGKVGL